MRGIAITDGGAVPAVVGHPIGGYDAGAAPARVLGPAGFPLWMVGLELPPGAALGLPAQRGDDVLYVCAGELVADGVVCVPGGAVVIESGARPRLTAPTGARVLHMGAVRHDGPPGSLARTPDAVHVVGPAGRFATAAPGRSAKYFADSTCPGCRATLLHNAREGAYVGEPHSHTADELIFLLSGDIRFGAHRVRPGDTVAIAAGRRYSFRSEGGFAFLNYRAEASRHVAADGSSRMEGALVNGMVAVAPGDG